jgi:hypothetical protein
MLSLPVPGVYILFFQIKLITLSTGSIKKRLKLFTLGAILCLTAFLLGSYIFSDLILQKFSYISQGIAIPLFIIGMIIILLGIYNFPAFLEFGWRENLIALIIVNRHNFNILYSYKFEGVVEDYGKLDSENIKLSRGTSLFSKGIIGIENVISKVTKTEEMNINKIHQGDLLILLERGEEPISNVIIGLFIKREMKSASYVLSQIKQKFQDNYKDILLNLEALSRFDGLFTSFDVFLGDILK